MPNCSAESPPEPLPVRDERKGLLRILELFTRLTGIPVCFHDRAGLAARGEIDLPIAYRIHGSPFCRLMKSRPEGMTACIACDLQRGNELAAVAEAPFLRRCHAGLWEALVPLRRGKRHLGTFFIGQSLPPGDVEKVLEPAAHHLKRLGIALEEIRAVSEIQPRFDEERLAEAAELLAALARPLAERLERLEVLGGVEGRRRARIAAALNFMHENLARPIALRGAALACHLSPSRLAHLFTEVTGRSFTAYLLEIRMERAAELLRKTGLLVVEVAGQCGFEDPSHFARRFKAHCGRTPREFRRGASEEAKS